MSHILAVDDEAPVLRLLCRILRGGGHTVEAATSGREALDLLARHTFDTALVDYRLPDMDGVGVLQAVHDRQPSCAGVLVTGYLNLPVAVAAVNRGAVRRVVRKPYDIVELLELIDEITRVREDEADSLRAATLGGGQDRRILDACLRSDDFTLALQPIVTALDGRPVGYEALIRCAHPVLNGPLPILLMAKKHGMFRELGTAVVARAAERLSRLPPDMRLFVNLHPEEFAHADALATRLTALSPWAERVVLEVTGECLARWPRLLASRVRTIRALGFEFALDDLGAGHSALSSLAEIEPAYIKTDLCIVRGVDHSPHKRRLVDMFAGFAEATGAKLIAEGVETESEAEVLRSCGVHLMQGFLFGHPSPHQGAMA